MVLPLPTRLALAALVAVAPAARAQDPVIANPPVLGTLAIIRVQFSPTAALDTNRWYEGELVTTPDGCSLVTIPALAVVNGELAEAAPGTQVRPASVSFGRFRSVQTRARPGDPWRVVDPTWVHSRALGCQG